MERTSHDQTSVVQMATATALAVRRRFRSCGLVGAHAADLDDLSQEAALHVVQLMQKKKLDPRKNPRGYLYRVASRRAAVAASRALAVVSISKTVAENGRARDLQRRVPIAGPGPARLLASPDRTDASVGDRDRIRARTTALVQMRRALEVHVAAFSGRERRALEMWLGWDGRSVDRDEVAWLTGLTRTVFAGIVRRFSHRIRHDARALAARRVIRETTEDR